uniref:Ferrochelatase n=1 Tax=Panagrolaimus sp. JU765 TaxID=591449 RepID=A0AC34QKV0_9BILA
MTVNKAVVSGISTGLAQRSGTTVLFLHHGQPRTPFYARQHLTKLWDHYHVPKFAKQSVTDAFWYSSKLLRKSVADISNYKTIDETVSTYVAQLEVALNSLTPEFEPVSCRAAYLFDSPSIEARVQEIIRQGTDSLMLVSLYPFDIPQLTHPMFSTANSVIGKMTRSMEGLNADQNYRIAINSPVSFNLLQLSNLGSHMSIVQYWSERIKSNLDAFDSVVFAVPLPLQNRKKYISMIDETTKRIMYVLYESYPRAVPWRTAIMYVLYESYPRAVPWRTAFYSPWNQFWPPISTHTVENRIKDLRSLGRSRTLVVPIGEFFQNFDTQTILPSIISGKENVQLLVPESVDQALVNSFAEIVKTSLLQRVAEQQKIPRVKTEATAAEALV